MSANKTIKKVAFLLAVVGVACLLGGLFFGTAEAAPRVKLDARGIPLMAPEIAVDHVAYSYQKKAIIKLKRLMANPRFKGQETELLLRLGRIQQENADILFRIAHGEAYENKTPIQLKSYLAQMKDSVLTLDRLIAQYPTFDQMPFALLMRARGFADIGARQSAIADFERIIRDYPQFDEVKAAYLALSEFAIGDGKHAEAIGYLKHLLKDPSLPDYPFALFKTAWAYFNLKDVNQAMLFAKRYVDYHEKGIAKERAKGDQPNKAHVHVNMRNEMLTDVPLFYAKGIELGMPEFSVTRAHEFFKGFSSGYGIDEIYDDMLMKFTKLLRSQGSEAAMVSWKDQILKREAKRPIALDIFMIIYEDQYNKYRFKNVVDSTKDLMDLHTASEGAYSFDRATAMLLDVATKIQKSIVSGKSPKTTQALSVVLIHVYRSYLKIANPVTDPGVFRVHFNIAEAFTALNKPDQAIAHYHWILENAKKNRTMAQKSGVNTSDAGLKAISIRFEDLKKQKIIPTDLKPRSMDDDKPLDLNPKLAEWVKWIFSVDDLGVNKKNFDQSDFYFFEANRALYHYGYILKSMSQMQEFVKNNPDSKYAVPMASLILDTMILSKNWNSANKTALQYAALTDWKDKAFQKRLGVIAADTYFKMAEEKFNEGDFKGVLSYEEGFNQTYINSHRKAEFLNLFSRAALSDGDQTRAVSLFDRIIKEVPGSQYTSDAVLLRSQYAEAKYDFESASGDLMLFLKKFASKSKPNEIAALKEKILLYTWLNEDRSRLRQLQNTEVCSGALKRKCELTQWLAVLEAPRETRTRSEINEAFKLTGDKTSADLKALAAAITLQHRKKFGTTEALNLIDMIVQGWNRLDAYSKFSMIAAVTEGLPMALDSARSNVRKENRMRADKNAIEARVAAVKKVEAAITKMNRLPWLRLQVESLNTIADLYIDIAKDIKGIPAPKGLGAEDLKAYAETMNEIAKPFEDTGKGIRLKTFELASTSGVEDGTFRRVATSFFEEHPDARKSYLLDLGIPAGRDLGIEILERVDTRGGWTKLNEGSTDPVTRVKLLWAKAVVGRKWGQVAFYLNEAKARSLIEPTVLSIMTSVTLSAAGAKAEGLKQLEEIRSQMTMALDEEERDHLTVALIQQFLPTLARDKVKRFLEEVDERQVAGRGSISQEESVLLSRWDGE